MKVMGFVVSFALCGLFLFSMLSFGVGVQDSYNVSEGLLSSEGINQTYTDLKTGLGGALKHLLLHKKMLQAELTK